MYVAARLPASCKHKSVHTIDQGSPSWWGAWAVRVKIKVGKRDRCDPAMGNGTRQWHLYVAAHPSAGYTCKQIRTQSTNAALTKRALQPHKWAMEQGNSTCVSPLALQQATRTNKRRHGSPLPTRHVFPSSMRYTGKAEGCRCECGPPAHLAMSNWRYGDRNR